MEIDSFLSDSARNDPSWVAAHNLVKQHLVIPGNILQLIRGSWNDSLEMNEFIRLLGFGGIGSSCLFRAAEINTEGEKPSKSEVERVAASLGLRYCGIVLAINAVIRSLLQQEPPPGWRNLLTDMMTDIEVGYRLGMRATTVGIENGVLAGFARSAGVSILMSGEVSRYREWQNAQRQTKRSAAELAAEIFGCEPYQASAFVLQQLGFGADAAIGLACAVGNINTRYLELNRVQQHWIIVQAWLQALREGRNYPANPGYRSYFKELEPPATGKKNLILEVLHTEIARVRSRGSSWTWHLPRATYEETKEAYRL